MRHSEIQKILVISLSNIGDIILTFPVVDILRENFPHAHLDVVLGPKGKPLLEKNPHIHNFYIFHKRQSLAQMFRWVRQLRKEPFDLVVDLRNTAIPFFITTKNRTSFFLKRRHTEHMRLQHLHRLGSIFPYKQEAARRYCVVLAPEDERLVDEIIYRRVGLGQKFIVVAPGAADRGKCWPPHYFARLCDHLVSRHNMAVVFAGDANDKRYVDPIKELMRFPAVDLTGEISLMQLAGVLKKSLMAVVNDSAPMHLASYLDIPVLAIFGPTDPVKYGPWSRQSCVVEKKDLCPACRNAREVKRHQCMSAVCVEDVLAAFDITPSGVVFYPPRDYDNIS